MFPGFFAGSPKKGHRIAIPEAFTSASSGSTELEVAETELREVESVEIFPLFTGVFC